MCTLGKSWKRMCSSFTTWPGVWGCLHVIQCDAIRPADYNFPLYLSIMVFPHIRYRCWDSDSKSALSSWFFEHETHWKSLEWGLLWLSGRKVGGDEIKADWPLKNLNLRHGPPFGSVLKSYKLLGKEHTEMILGKSCWEKTREKEGKKHLASPESLFIPKACSFYFTLFHFMLFFKS